MRYRYNSAIRDLQTRYGRERPHLLCHNHLCDHDNHPPIPPVPARMPAVNPALSDEKPAMTFVRYQRRELGGWRVVRADNGRALGWVVRDTFDKRLWTVHLDSSAFRGDGPDDIGDVLDQVPGHLYNGDPNNPLMCLSIDTVNARQEGVMLIVFELHHRKAPALGFPRLPQVKVYRTRASQHFPLHNGLCVCGEPEECPVRAELLARERT